MNITLTKTEQLRNLAGHPAIKPTELYVIEATPEHKFKVGDKPTLQNLQQFPEFNGQTVEITAVREDGDAGRAYYIKGAINQYLNWIYEYRLV